ncbi:MAG: SDR family NAD(P)-dependent oxidoreductase [Chitinophagaceae bacterium]
MFRLDNKIAVITGGGSGIGRAMASVFAKQGAYVFIVDSNEEDAKSVVAEIMQAGNNASYYRCNVADGKEVKVVMDGIAADAGKIDILVNNAGIAHVGNAETTSEADFDRLMSVNVKGVYNVLQATLPYMKKAGGAIINMASIASTMGLPDRFAYSATKGAVVGMTLSTAKDYLSYNIRCNCISPARVHTPFVDGFLKKNYPGKEAEMFEKLSKTQPIGRMAQPEEVAGLALYLCSDEASFITGCDYPIDGGFIHLNN